MVVFLKMKACFLDVAGSGGSSSSHYLHRGIEVAS